MTTTKKTRSLGRNAAASASNSPSLFPLQEQPTLPADVTSQNPLRSWSTMMSPELQPRLFRPYISTASSSSRNASPNLSSFTNRSNTHNARLAVELVPCDLFLLDLEGTPIAATLTLGLMISYIVDSLSFKFDDFFGVWLSLLFSYIALFLTSSSLLTSLNSSGPLSALVAFLCACRDQDGIRKGHDGSGGLFHLNDVFSQGGSDC